MSGQHEIIAKKATSAKHGGFERYPAGYSFRGWRTGRSLCDVAGSSSG